MTTAESKFSIAYTLFCDDIRLEQENKFSAMGVYCSALVLDAEIQVLPKFVALTVLELPAIVGGFQATAKLMDGEEILIEADLDVPGPPPGHENSTFILNVPIEVVPFTVKMGMKVQARIESSHFHYRSPVLDVIAASAIHTDVQPFK